jgi:TRAP-type mannitol/chloroaromatic compound transport system substrate-binding protein
MVSRAMKLYADRSAADATFKKIYTSIEKFKALVRGTWQRM